MRRRSGPTAFLAIGMIGWALPSGAEGGGLPVFEGLGDLPGGPVVSRAHAVSADGSTVVGGSVSSADPNSLEAFRWTASGGMIGLGDLGTAFLDSNARAVSGDGSIVAGEATTDSVSGAVPFRWSLAEGMEALVDTAGAVTRGQAFDVSNDGTVIVGVAGLSGPNQAFRWTAGTGMVGLGWLPSPFMDSFAFGASGDGSVLCGISLSGPDLGVETFRWTAANGTVGMGDVPGGVFYAIAWDVSDDGNTIVGEARTTFGNDEMFVWRSNTGFVLPDPTHGATFRSSVLAVSSDGSVAVGSGEGGAVIWDTVHGMRNVADLLTLEHGVDLTGWQLIGATGVSADGRTIVGDGLHPNGDREAWIARLPAAVAVPASVTGTGVALSPAGPNPFSSRAAFRLTVPSHARHVRATVHGVDGRVLRTIVDRTLPAGSHSIVWDGHDRAGQRTAAGVYFLRVQSGEETDVRKLIRQL